ncbi:putative membrane protein [Ehrlichia cf. muris str. EmCRT]|uniref:Putative membrane protein n=1 Tax=Ehrlichia cf. muris str. EmCRT TaxID=1359167 RepID=A0A0F3N6Z2_9RICK|nr:putative membrane protein [Ehrlichia cf. muris str. EmCRT]
MKCKIVRVLVIILVPSYCVSYPLNVSGIFPVDQVYVD